MFSRQTFNAAFVFAVSLFLASCSGGSGGSGNSGIGTSVDATLTVSAITGDLELDLGESKDYVVSISDADGIESVTTELLDSSDAFVQVLSNTNLDDTYTLTLDSSGLVPGTYRIQVTVVGVDGGTGNNSESTSVTFDVQVNALDAPLTVSDITGASNITVGDIANYSVSVSDTDGIDGLTTQLKDSSDTLVTALANSNVADVYTLVLDSSGLTPGIYTIEVIATGVDGGAGDNSGPVTETINVQILAVPNEAPSASSVSISDVNGGLIVVGDTLIGGYSYSDAESDAEGASTFRWLRNGSAIAGATSSSYALVVADSGANISFEVTPVAVSGTLTGSPAVSGSINVANSAPVATNVAITDSNGGSLVVGDELTASYDYSDLDGDAEGTSTYRWLRDGVAIAGAISSSYTLVAADADTEISFEVTPVATAGNLVGAAVTSAVSNVSNSAPAAENAAISDANGGAVIVGDELTGSYDYSDIDNDLEGTSAFRWLRDGAAISGATADAYTVVAADSGAEISFEVTPVAASGETTGAALESTSVTVVNSAPTAENASISDANGGSAVVGDQLDGTYDFGDLDEDLEGTSTFRWLRDGAAISGATGTSYTLVAADSGTDISFEVTPVAASGETTGEALVSSAISIINSAPVASNAAITDDNGGSAVSGDSLTGSYDFNDVDADAEGTSTYRWLRDGVAISGATSTSYTLVNADTGKDVSFEVTPIASAGETTGVAVESSALSVTNTSPTAAVVFPSTTVTTFTNQTSISVRGTASDSDGTVAAVSVNGVAASTSDGYANWTASVSLSSGTNALTVSVTDNLGATNASAASLSVRHEPTVLTDPVAIAEDIANDVIYILDTENDAVIYAFDTVNETYSVVSGGGTGSGDDFGDPVAMVYDSANDVLIVSDLLLYVNATPANVSALLEVDIATGDRTIIAHNDSLATAVGSGPTITGGYSLSLDGSDLIVADFTGSQIISVDVDPLSGSYLTRTQVVALGLPQYVSVDTNVADTAYIYQPFPSATFSSVVLSTGAVTTLSASGTGTGDMPEFVGAMVFDSGDDELLVADAHTNTLHAIDTSTGNRTVISDEATGSGIAATGDMYFDIDTTNDVLLIATNDQNGVIEFDLSTSVRSLLTPNILTSTGTELSHPAEVIADSFNSRYLVLDANTNEIVAVDEITGARMTVASVSENLENQDSSGMAIDTLNELAYVYTNNPTFSFFGDGDDAVIEVNLGTGVNTVISQNGGAGSGDSLSSPSGIAFDSINDRVLITDTTNWVVAVDTTTGTRSNLSNASNGSGTSMVSPKAISLDETNEIAYVADDNLDAIFAVDISTGANAGNRSILSDSSNGTGTDFESPTAVWFDETNARLVVADYNGTSSRIFAVDTTTGNRTVLADLSTGAAGECPASFTYDDTNEFVIGVDACNQSVLLMDLSTQQNVVFSK